MLFGLFAVSGTIFEVIFADTQILLEETDNNRKKRNLLNEGKFKKHGGKWPEIEKTRVDVNTNGKASHD